MQSIFWVIHQFAIWRKIFSAYTINSIIFKTLYRIIKLMSHKKKDVKIALYNVSRYKWSIHHNKAKILAYSIMATKKSLHDLLCRHLFVKTVTNAKITRPRSIEKKPLETITMHQLLFFILYNLYIMMQQKLLSKLNYDLDFSLKIL